MHSFARARFRVAIVAALLFASATLFAVTESVVHQFVPYGNGLAPQSSLVPDSQGNFYGTAYSGGTYGWGTVYQLSTGPNGALKLSALHSFQLNGIDGVIPIGQVAVDSAGNVYGVTRDGGASDGGIAFELSPSNGSWVETVIYNFTKARGGYGIYPTSGVVMDSAGNLYGSASKSVYELSPSASGWTATLIHEFTGYLPDCAQPGAVSLDSAGNVFGISISQFGSSDSLRVPNSSLKCDVLFELSPTSTGSWTFTGVHSFSEGVPPGPLAIDAAGNIYGAVLGDVFKLIKGPSGNWTWKLLASIPDAYFPGPPVLDMQGNVYGVTTSIAFKLSPDKSGNWTQTILHTFQGGDDGLYPYAALFVDKSGKVYGTTQQGGAADAGTAFQLSPNSDGSWSEKLIGFPATDGSEPDSTLVADSAGNFYGTTYSGGSSQCGVYLPNGCGTVFRLSRASDGTWKETVIHTFTDLNGDGTQPLGGVILDASGNLYGTASGGGTNGAGILYELSPTSSGAWNEEILYSFQGGIEKGLTDGYDPAGSLLFDSAGNLYGTTERGGQFAGGTVYKLSHSSAGWKEWVIYSLGGNSSGALPVAGVIMDASGNLYGTTSASGLAYGAAFELSPNGSGGWTETTLHVFKGFPDGATPSAPLILDSAGNLYGTTSGGGPEQTCSCGTVFEISPSATGWNEQVLYSFNQVSGGYTPLSGLTLDLNGNLFGTTAHGPQSFPGCGTVFELTRQTGGGWLETTAYSFGASPTDGCSPYAGITFDSAGNIWGTTRTLSNGVLNGGGTVFEITP